MKEKNHKGLTTYNKEKIIAYFCKYETARSKSQLATDSGVDRHIINEYVEYFINNRHLFKGKNSVITRTKKFEQWQGIFIPEVSELREEAGPELIGMLRGEKGANSLDVMSKLLPKVGDKTISKTLTEGISKDMFDLLMFYLFNLRAKQQSSEEVKKEVEAQLKVFETEMCGKKYKKNN